MDYYYLCHYNLAVLYADLIVCIIIIADSSPTQADMAPRMPYCVALLPSVTCVSQLTPFPSDLTMRQGRPREAQACATLYCDLVIMPPSPFEPCLVGHMCLVCVLPIVQTYCVLYYSTPAIVPLCCGIACSYADSNLQPCGGLGQQGRTVVGSSGVLVYSFAHPQPWRSLCSNMCGSPYTPV